MTSRSGSLSTFSLALLLGAAPALAEEIAPPSPPGAADQAPAAGGEPDSAPGPLRLGLREALEVAFEGNFGIRRARHALAASQSSLRAESNAFDFKLTTAFDQGITLSRNVPVSIGSPAVVLPRDLVEDGESLSLTLDKQAQWGGAFQWTSEFNRARASHAAIDPVHDSSHVLSYRHPLWGGRGRKVATSGLTSARIAFTDEARQLAEDEMRLAVDVCRTFYQVARSHSFIRISEDAVERAQERLRVARLRLEEGLITPIDVTRAQRDLQVRDDSLIAAQEAHADARDGLLLILGLPLETDFELVVAADTFQAVAAEESAAIAEALASRADLRNARDAVTLAELDAHVARSRTRPVLDLEVAAGFVGAVGDDAGKFVDVTNADTWQTVVSLSHTFGERRDDEALVRSLVRAESSRLSLAELERRIVADVRSAVRNIRALERRVEILGENVDLARQSLDLATLQFNEDLISTTDLLQDQSELVDAEIQHTDALFDHAMARVNLDLVLGRYWTGGTAGQSTYLEAEPASNIDVSPVGVPAWLPPRVTAPRRPASGSTGEGQAAPGGDAR